MSYKKYNFKQASFFTTVNDLSCLPKTSIKEIAIVGRSNAGKSSLLNTLTNQNKLAFTSKTPGRTQHINYFNLIEEGIFLVDLPGYGYAKVPESIRVHWVGLLGKYLATREQIAGLVIIMDSRHPLKELDYKMLRFFGATAKPIHIVLSKSDKLNNQEKAAVLRQVRTQLVEDGFSNFTVQLFSSLKKTGVDELEVLLNSWLISEDDN
ncbi:MAG: ribosome biogenesis GTP-binding protein YihA/YsxC [Burkholderiales bacterium]|nr:ribosome biogenesis GTP-binding protein YihA/YsxC [Burkholderiales bacterium]